MTASDSDTSIIVQTIIRLCTGPDGFLVRLHSYSHFDVEQYHALVRALTQYAQQLENERTIDRCVAGCLLALRDECMEQLTQENLNPTVQAAQRHVMAAFPEIEALTLQLLAY